MYEAVKDALVSASQNKELQLKLYDDLFHPWLEKAWKAIWNVVSLVNAITLPFVLFEAKANELFKKHLPKLEEELWKINEEDFIPISPDVWVPILWKLSHTSNEKIADMYISLLKKAADKKTVWEVHPKFIRIIENISEDEALLLEYLRKESKWKAYWIPLMTFQVQQKKWDSSRIEMWLNRSLLDKKINFLFPDNVNAYLSNLISEWILYEYDKLPITDEYERITERYQKIIDSNNDAVKKDDWRVIQKRKALWLTDLWITFLKVINR